MSSPAPAATAYLFSGLREARWLNAERAIGYSWILFALMAVWGGWSLAATLLTPGSDAPSADFVSFWSASKLALAGTPEAVYEPIKHQAAEQALFAHAPGRYSAFFYPPLFLLVCLPLSLAPYLVSVTLWLGVTGALYLRVGYGFLKQRAGLAAFLAYPAAFYNAAHGQNAFLTTALFGGGVLALNRRPILAGILLGTLAIKPHLGLLIPIALLAARRWTTFLAAAATVAALALLSLAVFGAETWRGFFAIMHNARAVLEAGSVGYAKMVSVFAALRLAGAPIGIAYLLQTAVALGAAAAMAFLIWKKPHAQSGGIALMAATPLASPFLLDYDLTLLALPIAWLVHEGAARGFLPWEKLILLAAFLLVLFSRAVATGTGIVIAPVVIAALFAAVMRRGLAAGE